MDRITWLLIVLGAHLIVYGFWEVKDFLRDTAEEKRRNREAGCRCPVNWLGIYTVSPECPVHKEVCTLSQHKSWYGEEYVTILHTSVDRVMVCRSCFEELSEQNMEMFYYRAVGKCGVCSDPASKLCIRVPANLVEDWIDGKTFHFSWNGEERGKSAGRRAENHDASTPQELQAQNLDRYAGDQECLGIRGFRQGSPISFEEEIHRAFCQSGTNNQSW